MRLGLVLAEIGRRNDVQVTDRELNDAMRQEALRYGGQAQQIYDLIRQNQTMQAQIRAPIFEEKVVDLIISRAQVTDKPVSKDELMAEDEMPEGYGGEPAAKPKAPKSAKATSAKAKAVKAEPGEVGAEPAAEAPAKPKAKAKAAKAEAAPDEAPAGARPTAKAKGKAKSG